MLRLCFFILLPCIVSLCLNDNDCSLLGSCVSFQCKCDEGWKGSQCHELDIRSGPIENGYQNKKSGASWGAGVIYSDGKYHAFIAEMENNQTLQNWGSSSTIIRAESNSPYGPFEKKETVIGCFSHNPTIRELPNDEGYVLYMIGQGSTASLSPFSSFRQSRILSPSGNIFVSHSKSIYGPWSKPLEIEFDGYQDSKYLNCGYTNPSPTFLNDGSVFLALQGGPCEKMKRFPFASELIGVAKATQWNSTYTLITKNPIVETPLYCLAGYGEDPFMWKSRRGYHIIFHGMCYAVFNAKMAFSVDGYTWNEAFGSPYSYHVDYSDGKSELLWRVERPQLLFSNSDNTVPIALTNGACRDGLKCLENPGKTFTLLRQVGDSV